MNFVFSKTCPSVLDNSLKLMMEGTVVQVITASDLESEYINHFTKKTPAASSHSVTDENRYLVYLDWFLTLSHHRNDNIFIEELKIENNHHRGNRIGDLLSKFFVRSSSDHDDCDASAAENNSPFRWVVLCRWSPYDDSEIDDLKQRIQQMKQQGVNVTVPSLSVNLRNSGRISQLKNKQNFVRNP